MASNEILHDGRQLYLPVAAGVLSGTPCIAGKLTGVALIDRDSLGNTTIDRLGVYNLSVKGVNDAGNVAVAVGDALYYIDANTPKLSKQASGIFFGVALQVVGSGATATIQVLQVEAVGQGLVDSGWHTMSVLTNGVTAVNVLGATLPIGLTVQAVYVIANDATAGNITLAATAGNIAVIAKGAVAGVMTGATTPLTNAAVPAGATLTVVSSSAGNATVVIIYTITS